MNTIYKVVCVPEGLFRRFTKERGFGRRGEEGHGGEGGARPEVGRGQLLISAGGEGGSRAGQGEGRARAGRREDGMGRIHRAIGWLWHLRRPIFVPEDLVGLGAI